MTSVAVPSLSVSSRRLPLTFWAGLLLILACEALLFADVRLAHRWALRFASDYARLSAPTSALGHVARWVAVNMTALCWAGYLLLLEGVLHYQGDSPVRKRPNHFAALVLVSVVIWCVFDWINFYFIHAWEYLGLPVHFSDRLPGYLLAFGAVVPGMLMSGQVLTNWGMFRSARCKPVPMRRSLLVGSLIVGAVMFAWPFWSHDPISNYTLWLALVLLLDPINAILGRPSMWRDLSNGSYERILSTFIGGLICGFLWEFWNFFAIAKWVYHLPFMGPFEKYRYFEMPLCGLPGFMAFGLECWVMWQTLRIPLDGLVEPLPRSDSLM